MSKGDFAKGAATSSICSPCEDRLIRGRLNDLELKLIIGFPLALLEFNCRWSLFRHT
jgi:hypothetical protein